MHIFLNLKGLSEFRDFAQLGLVDDFDAAAVDEQYLLGHKCRQGTDGVRGGHVRQVCQVLACHIYFEGAVVVFVTIIVEQHYQGLGQAPAYMLLGQVDYACVRAAQVVRQLVDKEPCQLYVLEGSNARALDTYGSSAKNAL